MMKPASIGGRKGNASNNTSRSIHDALDSNTCASYSPAPMSPVRIQRQAAGSKSVSVPTGGPSGDDGAFRGMTKTVGVPHANSIFKKKAGSEPSNPRSYSSVFAAPAPLPPPGWRNMGNHTDPFSEDRVRDNGKQKKLLTPKPKTPRSFGIRTSTERPADNKETVVRSTLRTKKDSSKSNFFDNDDSVGASVSPTDGSMSPPSSPSRRYQFSSQGRTSMDRETSQVPEKNHLRINEKMRSRQSMEGVLTVAQITRNKKSQNYKFVSPFARQLSSAITMAAPAPELSVSRRNQSKPMETFKTPFARDNSFSVGAKPRSQHRTFHNGTVSKTPFARHESKNVSQAARSGRRLTMQAKTDPFASHY